MPYILLSSDILMLAVFLLRMKTLPPQIPLFYSFPLSGERLADSWMIAFLPVLANLFFVVNVFLFKKFFNGNDFARKIIDFLNGFVVIAFALIFIRIILLVT